VGTDLLFPAMGPSGEKGSGQAALDGWDREAGSWLVGIAVRAAICRVAPVLGRDE